MPFRRSKPSLFLCSLTLTAAFAACSDQDSTLVRQTSALDPSVPDGNSSSMGSITLALTSGGVTLSLLRFRVEDASGNLILADTLDVADPSEVLSLEFDAPVGVGYLITLSAEGGAGVSCTGSSRFETQLPARAKVRPTPGRAAVAH